jgi:hypothetical protein
MMKCFAVLSAHQQQVQNAYVQIINQFQATQDVIWNAACHCQILKLQRVWLRYGTSSHYAEFALVVLIENENDVVDINLC